MLPFVHIDLKDICRFLPLALVFILATPALSESPSVVSDKKASGEHPKHICERPPHKGRHTATSSDPSSPAQGDVDFVRYLTDVQRRIKVQWSPPAAAKTKRVVVAFKINSDGSLANLRLERPCGAALANKAALDAVQNAAPFRPLPEEAPPYLGIKFTFDYNAFGGGGRAVLSRF
jgi:TonB family protein